jgi:hypothetical protein
MNSILSASQVEAELAEIRCALDELTAIEEIKPDDGCSSAPQPFGGEESAALKKLKDLHDRVEVLTSRVRTSILSPNLLHRVAATELLIERKIGTILARLHLPGGDHKSTRAARKLTLDGLGLTGRQSADWQLEARFPEEEFVSYLQQTAREGKIPSCHGLCCLARTYIEKAKLVRECGAPFDQVIDRLQSLANRRQRFACIYVDPLGAPVRNGRANGFHLDPRLSHLPLLEVAAPQAHLYLKVTPQSLEDGLKNLRAWGFSLKAWIARTTLSLDRSDTWRPVPDMLLLGLRQGAGGRNTGLPHWIEEGGVLGMDAAEVAYHFMERVSPPPYLDLFGFRPFSKDWTTVAVA